MQNNPIDQRRSVKINTLGISSTDFHLTKKDQKFIDLVEEGRRATRRFEVVVVVVEEEEVVEEVEDTEPCS
jgi:hypothetical protein